jgi:hypothetical protein
MGRQGLSILCRTKGQVAMPRKKPPILVLKKSDLPGHKITARRMMPKLPPGTTKADLREMLAKAAANTVQK